MKDFATVGLAALLLAANPQRTFRVGVEGVRVDVLATDGGRPVAGLKASDFELRDSGVPQQIESVAVEDVPLRVLLALDVSGSVRNEPLRDSNAPYRQ